MEVGLALNYGIVFCPFYFHDVKIQHYKFHSTLSGQTSLVNFPLLKSELLANKNVLPIGIQKISCIKML
jgi:hypothetical protein